MMVFLFKVASCIFCSQLESRFIAELLADETVIAGVGLLSYCIHVITLLIL